MDKFSGLLGKLSDSTFDFSYVISYKRGSTSWFKENLITNYHFDKISLSPKEKFKFLNCKELKFFNK